MKAPSLSSTVVAQASGLRALSQASGLALPAASQRLAPLPAEALPLSSSASVEKSWAAVYADLFKARLTLLVLLTTWVGFYAGVRGPMPYALMVHTLVGTALMAAGASALNQLWERQFDAKMRRTQDRPLPSGRLQPPTVFRVGASCG